MRNHNLCRSVYLRVDSAELLDFVLEYYSDRRITLILLPMTTGSPNLDLQSQANSTTKSILSLWKT